MNWKLNLGRIDGEFCTLEIDGDTLFIDCESFDYPLGLDKTELKDFIDGLKVGYNQLTEGGE